jgi:hypothetical protein
MKISDIKKYVVEYQLPYVHFVQVGVMAESSEAAIKAAQAAFDLGTIWDNTPTMPLLTDLYDETSNSTEPFQPLKFEAEEVEEWPQPDPTVRQIERENAAMEACRLLYQAYEHQDSGDEFFLTAALQSAKAALSYGDGNTLPPMPPLPTIVLGVHGGMVQWIDSNRPSLVIVLDFDVDGASTQELAEITLEDGKTVYVHQYCASYWRVDPAWVNSLIK